MIQTIKFNISKQIDVHIIKRLFLLCVRKKYRLRITELSAPVFIKEDGSAGHLVTRKLSGHMDLFDSLNGSHNIYWKNIMLDTVSPRPLAWSYNMIRMCIG